MKDNNRKSRLIALFFTVVFHALVVVLLLCLYLRYDGVEEADRTWPPVDSAELLFGGEYVMIGDRPELAQSESTPAPTADNAAELPSPQAEALENAGEPAEPAPVISSSKPSPMKVEKKPEPEKTGPTKEELEAQRKAAQAKREQEQRQAIANRVGANFSGAGQSGKGSAGSPDGNSETGAASGEPGHNLKGRSIAHYERPARGPLGTITIRVTVNRNGAVTSASYASGTGQAATSARTRQNCIAAARASKFSVDQSAPVSQTGTITYRFR